MYMVFFNHLKKNIRPKKKKESPPPQKKRKKRKANS